MSRRHEALAQSRSTLEEYRLEGIKTTIPLHLRLLGDEALLSGEYHTGYLEGLLNEKQRARDLARAPGCC